MSNISNLSAKFDSITSSSLQKMDSAIAQPNQSMEFSNRIGLHDGIRNHINSVVQEKSVK